MWRLRGVAVLDKKRSRRLLFLSFIQNCFLISLFLLLPIYILHTQNITNAAIKSIVDIIDVNSESAVPIIIMNMKSCVKRSICGVMVLFFIAC